MGLTVLACCGALLGARAATAAPPPPVTEYQIVQIFEGGIGPDLGPRRRAVVPAVLGREPRGFVERITQLGQVTGFTEVDGVAPTDIVQGPYGNIWFTEQAGGGGGALVGTTPAEKPAAIFSARC